MLPRKRHCEGVVKEEAATDSFPKKKNLIVTVGTEGSVVNSDQSLSSSSNNNSNSETTLEQGTYVMTLGDANPSDIYEDLYSRQLAVYGRETVRRLFGASVLVFWMQGLGAEIAKNLILAGVKFVTLHDVGTVELWNLSSSFVFSEKDLGKNRALASVGKLQELNNAVVVQSLTSALTKHQLVDFQAVVFTDVSLEKAIEFNDYCHNHQPPIAFIKTEVRGLFGSVFCDFGPEFTVFDVDGEEPHTGIVASVTNDNPSLVSFVDDEVA
ncbi:unnamed protein product [Lathyrus sativus]|nr:unnamed protein product [Lathyrus sativus]